MDAEYCNPTAVQFRKPRQTPWRTLLIQIRNYAEDGAAIAPDVYKHFQYQICKWKLAIGCSLSIKG